MMQMSAAVPHCSSEAEHVEETANQSARRRTRDTDEKGKAGPRARRLALDALALNTPQMTSSHSGPSESIR